MHCLYVIVLYYFVRWPWSIIFLVEFCVPLLCKRFPSLFISKCVIIRAARQVYHKKQWTLTLPVHLTDFWWVRTAYINVVVTRMLFIFNIQCFKSHVFVHLSCQWTFHFCLRFIMLVVLSISLHVIILGFFFIKPNSLLIDIHVLHSVSITLYVKVQYSFL